VIASVRFWLIAILTCLILTPSDSADATDAKNIWETTIVKFEEQDRQQMPAEGGIVFVGSSSIRLWDLEESFPEWKTINRGFGGSQASDSAYYAERIVVKYKPRLVVFYAGDNDLALGKSPEQVRDDIARFTTKIRTSLPDCKVILLSIKPSGSRWNLRSKQSKANELIKELALSDPHLQFIDVGRLLLGPDGRPRSELFLPDQLHLNADGYRLWAQALLTHLKE
jgi:lysophospholipase L1-like esterase